ncbi:carbohydrate kinase family protein [Frigoriflavimonas asaccharolytica]|uniref:Fructokinase n=1 Tax=Frigoriflavimonas asaccharolytica TaxID=2735899 RepID=A0A8J8GAB0_9FLAO|nr:carbohydrate kinase [Frigoriflavimonas asaccharolytica]NRS93831.1 fructokinase [Frigoriflavimonas asaccharolytica]
MIKATCFGEVLWDVFPTHKKIGGAPLNVAVRLESMQNEVSVISSVGDDELGANIIDFLQENNVNSTGIQIDDKLETSIVAVTLDSSGSASYEIVQPRAWDNIVLTDIAKNLTKEADIFIYGSLAARNSTTRNTLYELLKLAKYKVFDVNLRKPYYSIEVLNHLMNEASFIKFNDDEIFEIAKLLGSKVQTLEENILFIAKETNTDCICVTLGSKGAILYFEGIFYSNSGYKITVADTVGAGDSFLGTLINKLIKKENPQKSIDYACAVGALVASEEGANPKIGEVDIQKLIGKTIS